MSVLSIAAFNANDSSADSLRPCGAGVADTGDEGQAVDQLAAGDEAVAAAQAVDDLLGVSLPLLPLLSPYHYCRRAEPSRSRAGIRRVEVLGGAAIIGTEAAAVMPVGAGEEPPGAAFAQQGVPHATDQGAVRRRCRRRWCRRRSQP